MSKILQNIGRITELLVFILLVSVGSKAIAAEDLRYFHLLSGDAAGSGFEMAAAMAAAISGPPGAPPCSQDSRCGVPGLIGVAQSSPGPLESIALLADNFADAAIVRQSLLRYANEKGMQQIGSEGRLSDLRHVSNIGVHELHIFVASHLKITRLDQLTHYRIAVGSPRSEVPYIAQIMFDAAGMNYKRMQLQSMPDVAAADMLAAGALDAFVFVGNMETDFIADMVTNGIVDDVLLDDAVLDKIVQQLPTTYKLTMPLPNRPDAWVERIAFPVGLIVNRQAGVRLVESVLSSVWWEGNQALIERGGLGPLTYARAFEFMQQPLHDGAARYFKDHGGMPRDIAPLP